MMVTYSTVFEVFLSVLATDDITTISGIATGGGGISVYIPLQNQSTLQIFTLLT